ncbi:Elongator complex protein 1 [Chionoecetes opilio]|uniref:Elongator complex protein 1 n=1 Tax=Chionoecetes opilio TaxID=41210 RepID=A0A8J4XQG1_CHIOP|nr:Elongator complex protein 1 [Chionoecetes opilio]
MGTPAGTQLASRGIITTTAAVAFVSLPPSFLRARVSLPPSFLRAHVSLPPSFLRAHVSLPPSFLRAHVSLPPSFLRAHVSLPPSFLRAHVEEVGAVSGGVAAASWSPDQEHLALVTPAANLLLMTSGFEVTAEVPLGASSGQAMVALGWGSKATQFHGTEGRDAATQAKTTALPAPPWDHGRPVVTWRGDGELLAVSHFPGDSRTRRIVVVDAKGCVVAVAEGLDGLQPPVAWRPNGSVFAVSYTTAGKHQVAFVEKNGLQHGGFVLPFRAGCVEVVALAWSGDSTVLAVWGRPLEGEGGEVVQLWTTGNYHWYLKQEIRLPATAQDEPGGGGGGGLVVVQWGEAAPPLLSLHLVTPTHHHSLTLLPAPHHTLGQTPQDTATAAVVDGHRLLLTPFRLATVPPPMAAYTATFPEAINSLAFCVADAAAPADVNDSGFLEGCEDAGVLGSNALCVQHGPHSLTLLAPTTHHPPPPCSVTVTPPGAQGLRPLGVCGQYRLEWGEGVAVRAGSASELYHWAWPRRDTLVAVFGSAEACHLVFVEVQAEAGRAVATQVVPLEDWVVAVAAWPNLAALQLASGALLKLDLATRTLEPFLVEGAEVAIPAPCQQLCLCPVEGCAPVPLGLTPRGRLYLGHRQLLAHCTSVAVHTHHLLATTSAHSLLALPLTPQGLMNPQEAGPGVRRVERGARIVLAVGHDTRVLLQMPRGNLEVVSPRPLAIHALARLLATRQYGAALELARRHRIDANLLYDHHPAQFLAAAKHFVRDVDDPRRVDVFLAALTHQDASATTYAFHYPGRPANPDPGKVRAACDAVRAAMEEVDEGRHLLPILTSLVKAGDMAVALARVGGMRQRDEGGAEEGLRHLLYLADTEELYRLALGTHDLALALMVAQHSAKDPKEYLPQLNGLRQLPEPLRRFRINVLLRRFRPALLELHDQAAHREEAVQLVQREGLHAMALQLLPPKSQLKVEVCQLYGRHLLAKSRPSEAAIMLGRAGQHAMALEAYRAAGNWQMALVTASSLGLAKEQLAELCQGLAEELREQGRHPEAARLYEQHLANEEEAVACLATAGDWQDALRLAHKHGRPDLVETNVRPGALQQAAATRQEARDTAAALALQVARLSEVRVAKQRQHSASLLLAAEDAPLDCDLYSDASTVSGRPSTASSATARSQRSSKSRRKLERKKYSTREGGPQEDLGLVAALHETYAGLVGRAEAVGALCAALVTLGHDTEAATLQEDFSELLSVADSRRAEVWPPLLPPSQDQVEFGPQLTSEGAVQQLRAGHRLEGAANTFLAQRMAELDSHLRHPPPPPRDTWRLGLLADEVQVDSPLDATTGTGTTTSSAMVGFSKPWACTMPRWPSCRWGHHTRPLAQFLRASSSTRAH